MTGNVKMYNSDRGYGFILGEDMKSYFFHISDVQSTYTPKLGQKVTYTSVPAEKGPVAKEIKLIPFPKKQDHIIIGNRNIQVSDIVDYGISSKDRYLVKVYKKKEFATRWEAYLARHSITPQVEWTGDWYEIDKQTYDKISYQCKYSANSIYSGYRLPMVWDDGVVRITEDDFFICKADMIISHDRYLYVTTRRSNFQFFEKEAKFNIEEKYKELDKLLGGIGRTIVRIR